MATAPLFPQNAMQKPVTLVMSPCYAGAAWNLAQVRELLQHELEALTP